MSLIEWNVEFYTGHPEVDRQHNKLVALVNRLGQLSNADPELLDQVFQELNAYVVEHFSLEERLMEEAAIDTEFILHHKNEHALFVKKLDTLWNARKGGTELTLNELFEFLTSWIQQHLMETDRHMAELIHEKLGSAAPHNMFTPS